MRTLTNGSVYITERQASEILSVSIAWLRAARYSGRADAPPFYRFGGNIRYRRDDLEAWAESRRVTGSVAGDEK